MAKKSYRGRKGSANNLVQRETSLVYGCWYTGSPTDGDSAKLETGPEHALNHLLDDGLYFAHSMHLSGVAI
jgi:hypothetical protein